MMRVAAQPESAEAFATALKATVDFWHASGQRVLLFYNPPQGIDPKGCGRRVKGGGVDTTMCSQTPAQAAAYDGDYRQTLADILSSSPSVTYFDPVPYFCESGACTVLNGSEVLYEDFVKNPINPALSWSHLSGAGAVFLAEKAEGELVAQVLGAARN